MSASQTSQASAAASAVFGWPGLFDDSTNNAGTFSGLAVSGVVLIVNAGALSGAGVKWQFNNDSNQGSIDQSFFSNWGSTHLPSGPVDATSCIGREGTPGTNTILLGDPSCFGTMVTLAEQSFLGTITTATTLSLGTGGIGTNPPSYYSPNPLSLQWLEVQPADGLPLINSNSGSVVGPMCGCFSNNGSIGPAC